MILAELKAPFTRLYAFSADATLHPPTRYTGRPPPQGTVHILNGDDDPIFRDMVVQAVWAELARGRAELARGRASYEVLDAGLECQATTTLLRSLKDPHQHNRLKSIFQAGVWTPSRADRVNAGTSNCIHCGVENVDVKHLWWECRSIPRVPPPPYGKAIWGADPN